jgi:TrmH family RNA methyltransferase
MLSNNRISFVKSLHQKKNRFAEGLFLAEGDKLVREYLQSDFQVEEVYAQTDWLKEHGKLIGIGVESYGATSKDLERLSTLISAPDVIAVVKVPQVHIATAEYFSGLTLVLDGIRDPGNMGTIIRTADWFGVDRIVASDDSAEHWNPKVVQASMGSLTRIKIVNHELVSFFTELNSFAKTNNRDVLPVYGTFLEGKNVYKEELTTEGFIVIGNEANGIREATETFVNHRIAIPSFAQGTHKAESLNAAIATALVLAEFRRTEI